MSRSTPKDITKDPIQSLRSFFSEQNLSLKSDQIQSEPDTLKYYGKDWTTYYDIAPLAVFFPENNEQVVAIVKWALSLAAKWAATSTKDASGAYRIGLVPSGGRTGLSGAACALHGEVVVSFDRMNRILDFDEADMCVRLQAGVVTETLQKFALEKGLYYPVDFAARGSSQIGGNIATNAGGIKVVRYGLTRDWVMSLKVVTGSGELVEFNQALVKNATGYDFRHLFIGSEGTLGFIVEAEIKLAPPPPTLQVMVLAVPDLQNIMKVFSNFKKSLSVVAFEFFSEAALQKVIANTGLQRPFATVSDYYVVCEVEKKNELEEETLMQVFESCLEQGYIVDGALAQSEAQAKSFWRLREDISESLAKYSPYKNDISVRISKVPSLVQELDVLLKTAYPTWEVIWFGHIGDGNLHINILRPSGMSKEDFVQECRKVDEIVFACVGRHHGSISAEHGVGLSKKSFLKYTRTEAEINWMREIKKIFDPEQILNPGKVF